MSLDSSPSAPFYLSPYVHLFSLQPKCKNSTAGPLFFTAFTITNVLILLPLYLFILYLGLQRWWRQRSSAPMSHSDVFTYHMVTIEQFSVLGSVLQCCGIYSDVPDIFIGGAYLFISNLCGEFWFHLLTCLERYLAVVHPVTYLRLRSAKGIRMRDIIIGCCWLLSFALPGVIHVDPFLATAVFVFVSVTTLIVTLFCSLSVLWVLIRPGPGEVVGRREQVDESKLRAFYTIMIILGVLVLRYMGCILSAALQISSQLGRIENCAGLFPIIWMSLPSNLVLPLLFLHRAEKLPCFKRNIESG